MRRKIRIIGVSDGDPVKNAFTSRFGSSYKNFEYHVEPFLDITRVVSSLESIADVVICSEVLEHVVPPIDKAFFGLNKILKPGGWIVLSVPHTVLGVDHVEHFPILKDSELCGEKVLILQGFDPEGNYREFQNLIFHGGAGATLEYRVFSEESVRSNLQLAGFTNIEIQKNNNLFGIFWEPWSRVWIAQKPIF